MSEETFAQEIRRRRDVLRLSQAELAKLAGVARNTISNIERGQGETDRRVVYVLRGVLDATESGVGATQMRPARRLPEPVRESIARTFDALVDALSEDLVPADSTTAEAVAIRATRRAYQNAARIARGEDL